MTYCVAAVSQQGIVFASDSRTNAGVDQISVFSKTTVFEVPGERVLVLLSAGNLGTSQSVMSLLRMRARFPDGQPDLTGIEGLHSMYEVAVLVGQVVREVTARDGPTLVSQGIDASCTLILGGQIRGEAPRLFLVYPQGNFIESTADTNYFQIGETKYGKPMIDRVVKFDTPLSDVAKCLLVSFDATMRSNLSVGPPIDLLGYEADALKVTLKRRYEEGDPYIGRISAHWSGGLLQVFAGVPEVSWS